MKISRIVLDLGISKKDLKLYSDEWTGQKVTVINDFNSDPDIYLQRIKNLVNKSIEQGADIILFPACTFIQDKDHSNKLYQKMLSNDCVLIAGTLDNAKPINENIPIKLIINNENIRYVEVEFGFKKKAYALLATPALYEMRYGKKRGRTYQFLFDTGDIVGTKKEMDELINTAFPILIKYLHCLDYSKNIISTDETIEKLIKLKRASQQTLDAIKNYSTISEIKPSLFDPEESIIDNYSEKIVIINQKEIMDEFDSSKVKWLQIKNINAMVAISSTIVNIYKDFSRVAISDRHMPKEKQPVIAFDSGHHQYSGRYKNILQKVASTLKKDYASGMIFLAYWKYLNSKSDYVWAEPSNLESVSRRFIVSTNNKNDFVDLFEV
ncbi:hypothetical protein [Clostridium sp.]|uniref:hypothetical protein n=1 Tax=Clostridium sp. TaxID=1506 RepID=UPI00284EEDDC|nr:hypothetical protein [Clostridium sp.]MDR3598839.1 hypothetical protein [Clostridium sp.]